MWLVYAKNFQYCVSQSSKHKRGTLSLYFNSQHCHLKCWNASIHSEMYKLFSSVEHAISWLGKEAQRIFFGAARLMGSCNYCPNLPPVWYHKPRVFILFFFRHFPLFRKKALSPLPLSLPLSIRILDQTRRGREAITFPDYLYLIHNAS